MEAESVGYQFEQYERLLKVVAVNDYVDRYSTIKNKLYVSVVHLQKTAIRHLRFGYLFVYATEK